jgi:hypothetical protein
MEASAILLILGVLYFIPSIQAYSRKHNNSGAVLATNLLLGWTILGWIIAMIWASTDNIEGKK